MTTLHLARDDVRDISIGDRRILFHVPTSGLFEMDAVGGELLVPALPADADALADWLSQHRGSRVSLRVPQRGDKKTLLETVSRNAGQALAQHKLRRAGDLTTRS